jgi:CheY-like chemotaxis protein
MAVVAVASSAVEALRCRDELQPDVVLVDIDLGAESGFDVAELLHQPGSSRACSVILISTHAEDDFADMIAASPAVGFLAKSALTPTAIRSLVSGSSRVQEGEHG